MRLGWAVKSQILGGFFLGLRLVLGSEDLGWTWAQKSKISHNCWTWIRQKYPKPHTALRLSRENSEFVGVFANLGLEAVVSVGFCRASAEKPCWHLGVVIWWKTSSGSR